MTRAPPPEAAESKFDVDAYLPVMMTIPVKPMRRQRPDGTWNETPLGTEVILDAGTRDRVKFLLISASEYADPNCSKNPVALIMQFSADEKDKPAQEDWIDGDKEREIIWLQGPLLFSGYTLAMLPKTIDRIYVQNHRGKEIDLKILIGKSFTRPSSQPIIIGEPMLGATHRNGTRQLVASR